ncbi:MAG: TRAP transporter small permease subunit [Thalassobaculaceae bacterium]
MTETTASAGGHRIWRGALGLAHLLERPVIWVGEAVAWLQLVLVVLIIADAISRRYIRSLSIVVENNLHFFFNSPAIQDGEWHLHAIILFCALGYAGALNAHIRLDILRPRFSDQWRLWIELIGGLTLLAPFVLIFIYEAGIFFSIAWRYDEAAGESNGIGNRWFIKFFILFGPSLFFLSGLSIMIRLSARLFGPADLRARTRTDDIANPTFSAYS